MSEISKQALLVDNSISFPDNNAGSITPSDLRAFNVNVIQSTVNQTEYTENSASWNSKIDQLNAFTASQQPSFNALNSFTASQTITNTNLNAFTQSAGQELDSLSAWTGSWNAWTSSLNEIRDDGVLQGYSTRFFFNGLVSASIVQNVGGNIANVTVEQDGTKLNTASFNSYTASAATSVNNLTASFNSYTASQNSFNTSATASISELLALSSSLSGGYATQGELDYSSSVLQANIDTKLNTSSFNAYTASLVGFATTGSNIFTGDQTIYKASGKLTFQSGSSNTAAIGMTGLGNLQLEVQSTAVALLEQNAVTLQKPTTINGNTTIKGNSLYQQNNVAIDLIKNANYSGSQYNIITEFTDVTTDPSNVYSGYQVVRDSDGLNFASIAVTSYSSEYGGTPTGIIIGGGQTNGSDTAIGFPTNAGIDLWKPTTAKRGLIVTGSLTLTGSAYGNVISASISSNTASLNLSNGNFFTLTLPATGSTNINITNPRPGTTALLKIINGGVATTSFSSNVKQQRYNSYIPSSGSGAIDLLSIQAFDASNIFVTKAQNFV